MSSERASVPVKARRRQDRSTTDAQIVRPYRIQSQLVSCHSASVPVKARRRQDRSTTDAQIVRPYRIQSQLVSCHSASVPSKRDVVKIVRTTDAQIVRPYRIQSQLVSCHSASVPVKARRVTLCMGGVSKIMESILVLTCSTTDALRLDTIRAFLQRITRIIATRQERPHISLHEIFAEVGTLGGRSFGDYRYFCSINQ